MKKKLLRKNLKDVKNLKRKNILDRLILDSSKIKGIISSIKEIKNFLTQLVEHWRVGQKK